MKIYLAQSAQGNEINTIGFYLTKRQALKAVEEDMAEFAEELELNAGYQTEQIELDREAMTVETDDGDYAARWQITTVEQSLVAGEIKARIKEHSEPEGVPVHLIIDLG